MSRRGAKPKRKNIPAWTPELAYACGLMASDGCLYSDGRHMSLTSQDLDQLETFKRCLGLTNKISWKPNGYTGYKGSQVQFSDATLHRWFISIGITPRKTFTIGKVKIPDKYFSDYLRGEFDGDGSSHGYWDTRWHSSVSIYISFASASIKNLIWLRKNIKKLTDVSGIIKPGSKVYNLEFSKKKAKYIYEFMYYNKDIPFLKRKKDKLDRQWAANELAKLKKQPIGYIKGGSMLRIA